MKTKIWELVYNLGALSIRPKILVANGTVFSGYFALLDRYDNLMRYTQNVEIFFRKISVSFASPPGIFGWMESALGIAVSMRSNFRNLTFFGISGNFPRKFPYISPCFEISGIFRRMERALDYLFIIKNRQFERLSGLHKLSVVPGALCILPTQFLPFLVPLTVQC